MMIPARRLLVTAGVMLVAAIAASVWRTQSAWMMLACAVGLTAVVDLLLGWRTRTPEVHRTVSGALAIDVDQVVTLRLVQQARRTLRIEVFDHVAQALGPQDLPRQVSLPFIGGSDAAFVDLSYRIRPVLRGCFDFGPVEMRIASPLGLWQRRVRASPRSGTQQVKVYPNFAAVAGYALLATDRQLAQIGVLKRRRRGIGSDFHQLRDYREGDSQRQIDWKATSRMGRLIARDYQDERDQQIVLLIDCGRRMAAHEDAAGPNPTGARLSHLDHVLDAALLLAHVALRQGDAVGVLAVGALTNGSVHGTTPDDVASLPVVNRWLAPRKSPAMLDAIMNQLYDLQPSLVSTDYHAAASELMVRVPKRALVVMLTNLRDEDDDTLAPALRMIAQRHLVLLASLRETVLEETLAAPVHTLDDALTHAATLQYLERRETSFARLQGHGAMCLDVEPRQLALGLVNRYIDIKRAGRI